MQADQQFMAIAIRLAEQGRYITQPNPRVGCVIVKQGKIIGQGHTQAAGEAHAEIMALQDCLEKGNEAHDADIYISLEPCSHQGKTPPCVDALIRAKPARVIIAMQDPNPLVEGKGIAKLQAQGIKTSIGVCETDAAVLNRGFIKRMRLGKPFVTLKMASSLDGRIAMENGESLWITSAAARKEVHRMRLQSCALITGINTVIQDNPRLTARLEPAALPSGAVMSDRQPIRVVLDSQNRLAALGAKANIFQQPGETWQIISGALPVPVAEKQQVNRVVSLGEEGERINLEKLLGYLGKQEMNEVMVEAGGNLAASFIQNRLLDEIVLFQSADIMGSSAQAMVNLPNIMKMDEKIEFEYQDVRKIGRDLKLTLRPTIN